MYQFKEAISLKFSNAPVENLCLIFAGKIMKDAENLNTHHVKDGKQASPSDDLCTQF